MASKHTVDLYFDFVSPYSYLALSQVEAFGQQHGVDWTLRPVVYGALLNATGLVGPAEVAAKRRYTFRDIVRTAELLEIPLVGPPSHPFRSLEALRAVCLYRDHELGLRFAVALATTCWGAGKPLTELDTIARAAAAVGLDDADLGERINASETKSALRASTEASLDEGVFGVPTFRLDGELFWGHDRLDHLAARIDGTIGPAGEATAAMEQRPRGVDRTLVARRASISPPDD